MASGASGCMAAFLPQACNSGSAADAVNRADNFIKSRRVYIIGFFFVVGWMGWGGYALR